MENSIIITGLVIIILVIPTLFLKVYLKNILGKNKELSMALFVAFQLGGFLLLSSLSLQDVLILKTTIKSISISYLSDFIGHLGLLLLIISIAYIILNFIVQIIVRVVFDKEFRVKESLLENNYTPIVLFSLLFFVLSIVVGIFMCELFLEIMPEIEMPRMF